MILSKIKQEQSVDQTSSMEIYTDDRDNIRLTSHLKILFFI
jgi:hypothetical protein